MRSRTSKSRPRAASGRAAHSTRKPARAKPARVAAVDDRNLRQALIDAAVELANEGDPAEVTVRDAGRRAGVSAATAARHFDSRAALMRAVAAEAFRRFNVEMQLAVAVVAGDDPVERLRAIGHAFIGWAQRNPTHFQVLSARHLIGFAQAQELRDDVQDVAGAVIALTAEAQRRGRWPAGDTRLMALASRAMAYGLARMRVDGQLSQWGIDEAGALPAQLDALDLYVDMLSRAAGGAPHGQGGSPAAPRAGTSSRRDGITRKRAVREAP